MRGVSNLESGTSNVLPWFHSTPLEGSNARSVSLALQKTQKEISERCREGTTTIYLKNDVSEWTLKNQLLEEENSGRPLSARNTTLLWTLSSSEENEEVSSTYWFHRKVSKVFMNQKYEVQFPDRDLKGKKIEVYFVNESAKITATHEVRGDSIHFMVPLSNKKKIANPFFDLKLSIDDQEIYTAKKKFQMFKYFNKRGYQPEINGGNKKARPATETSNAKSAEEEAETFADSVLNADPFFPQQTKKFSNKSANHMPKESNAFLHEVGLKNSYLSQLTSPQRIYPDLFQLTLPQLKAFQKEMEVRANTNNDEKIFQRTNP